MNTQILPVSEIASALSLLRAGELVAFPTETVYGLGADARSDAAVQKIYDAKGRPAGNPIIVHVSDIAHARQCAAAWPKIADRLAKKFWPGPLTLIVPRGPSISPLVSAGRDTVALRCPSHPVAQELLQQFAGPIAAPSANRSGFTSPTTAAHVFAELAGRIPLILDGGPCEVGVESTVVDLTSSLPTILRPGAVTLDMLRTILPSCRQVQATIGVEDSAVSPGQHTSHYAPQSPAYRFPKVEWPIVQHWAKTITPLALLSHDDMITLSAPHETVRLPNNDAEYARVLYAALRGADDHKPHSIFILLPENRTGLWGAIHDRLQRATSTLPHMIDR